MSLDSPNPSSALFNPRHLPPELMESVDLNVVAKNIDLNAVDIFDAFWHRRGPTLTQTHTCVDMINGKSDEYDKTTWNDIQFSAKLASVAYSMPFFFPQISDHLHYKNYNFFKYMSSFVSESTFLANDQMDKMMRDEVKKIMLPDDAQMAGFYIRTPIRIWNKSGERIYTIPDWDHRKQLLADHVVGNVNIYVLRKNTPTGFECYILFRGTSNEFNAIPQYGEKMKNTQVYRFPDYDPIEKTYHHKGSETIPLFYPLYSEMIDDAMPHILKCLEWLKVGDSTCERIVATGHSMGGALVTHFCYHLKMENPLLWRKTYFRTFAAPMSCNHAAVVRMEQWIIDSHQPNKFIQMINRDDFINIQPRLGGKEGVAASVKQGTSSVAAWLIQAYFSSGRLPKLTRDEKQSDQILQIAKTYPHATLSAFLQGALNAQITNAFADKRAAFRLGQRREEIQVWKTPELKDLYQNTLKLYFCERNIDWNSEYVGKSHGEYSDTNMGTFWAPTKLKEDDIYKYYAKHGLKVNNNLHILCLFPERDLHEALALVAKYEPIHKVARATKEKY